MMEAVELILSLKFAADQKLCDHFAFQSVQSNSDAIFDFIGEAKRGAPEEPIQPMRVLILNKSCFIKIVPTCISLVEDNVERAIRSIDDDGYKNLTAYLSDDFISRWLEKGKSMPTPGIEWKKMNANLSWSSNPFNQQELMLQQMFNVTQERPDPSRGEDLFYALRSGEMWPRIAEYQVFEELVRATIVAPCTSYLRHVGKDALDLLYMLEKREKNTTSRLVENRPDAFLAELFRYEFCHLDEVRLSQQLWRFYSFSTIGCEVVQKVAL